MNFRQPLGCPATWNRRSAQRVAQALEDVCSWVTLARRCNPNGGASANEPAPAWPIYDRLLVRKPRDNSSAPRTKTEEAIPVIFGKSRSFGPPSRVVAALIEHIAEYCINIRSVDGANRCAPGNRARIPCAVRLLGVAAPIDYRCGDSSARAPMRVNTRANTKVAVEFSSACACGDDVPRWGARTRYTDNHV